MTLGRDDVLRELELLPVWRLNVPLSSVPMSSLPVPAAPAEPAQKVEKQTAVEQSVAETVTMQEQEEVKISAEVPLQIEPQADSAPPQTLAQTLETTPVTKMPIAWMLVCAQIKDPACQALFDNIIKALRLNADEYVLVHKRSQMMAYDSQRMVLFGLNAANVVLNQTETDIQRVRGRIHQLGQTQYIVTHAPQELLTEPVLKKEVWQDLCLLLA